MNDEYIKCKWLDRNMIIINPDGQIIPCCYLSNRIFYVMHNNKNKTPGTLHPVITEYIKHKDELNINNHTLVDILSHEWYEKTLPESWKDEKTCSPQCKQFCTKDTNN